MSQNWFSGGPYNTVPDNAVVGTEARAFAVIGGLIGQSISMRARYQNFTVAPTPGYPTSSRLALIVTPYAAGEGL